MVSLGAGRLGRYTVCRTRQNEEFQMPLNAVHISPGGPLNLEAVHASAVKKIEADRLVIKSIQTLAIASTSPTPIPCCSQKLDVGYSTLRFI
jgi:hypothetical protein